MGRIIRRRRVGSLAVGEPQQSTAVTLPKVEEAGDEAGSGVESARGPVDSGR